jgi:uncharacterized protein with von Willebrand factor type A (vWA) domain
VADPLLHNLVHFTRYLRSRGLPVVPETAVSLVEAAEAVGLGSRDDIYHAFRAVVVTRKRDIPVFDEAFELYFGRMGVERPALDDLELRVHRRGPRAHVVTPVSVAADTGGDTATDATDQVGASAVERLSRRDFAELTADEYEAVRRLVARMVWHPAEATSRRWVPAAPGRRPDLRRTMRRLVGPTRDLVPLAMMAPKPRQRPLLVLADVSGSMERYTEMLLYFIHAARGSLGRVEAFVFSTKMSRITRELRHRDPAVALARVGAAVHDWSSGTLIGSAFERFNRDWSRRVARGGPIAIIISDGWDRGDPELLRREVATLARSVHRVIWLNPLAGRGGYQPEVRGMRTVLPYVDDFMPAASLRDLTAVVRLLESVPKRKELAR